MSTITIQQWINGLGRTYEQLVAAGVVPNSPLIPLFEGSDNDDLIQRPAPGVELWFGAKNRCLEQVMIALLPTVGQPVYTGSLPSPFSLEMDQKSVRNALGEPMASQGPVTLPGGRGKRGGSDTYRLSAETHLNAKVTLGYLENLAVNNISFSLIDKGHD
ncbi:DUF6392 family protein [Pseudomonas chlororaphis]|uniref:Pyocin immunity protein n=1 Tax=Pseudomonas chlororaphis O6 TaxID=1037915 RepID=A0AB33WQI5_9PSED|nr:DUF6392 family protein [Pseudomonas chlororaphis]EIM15276.1 hypothetical protein PchlO6_2790 [Pseudomonas chlororaphis O6]